MIELARVSGVVFDASMLINVLAAHECAAIVTALGLRCVAPIQAIGEVRRHPVSGQAFTERKPARSALAPIEPRSIKGRDYETFLELAGAAPPNGLGDGEAASIALANALGFAICLDDGKARRICAETFPSIVMAWSAELIGHKRVVAALGAQRAKECYDCALQFGRMRRPPK